MPDFLIIGAVKCGTTSQYAYLIEHSWTVSALRKEVYFFDRTFRRGLAWYRSFFPTLLEKKLSKQRYHKDIITGEAIPCYMFHPHAPRRIFEVLPKVKLIVVLRNPVDRAYSFYWMQFRRGIETLSFEEAIEKEEERLQGELERMLRDENYFSFNRQNYSYLSRGCYVDQLKQWMKFFHKENILIIRSEDLYTDSSKTFRQVLDFLNLPHWDLKVYKHHHHVPYPKIDATTRTRLIEYFKPHNQQLYELLGVNFHWNS